MCYRVADEPGAERHPGEDTTLLNFCSLCQAFVSSIRVQADRPLFAIKTADSAESIFRVSNERTSFERERTSASIRLALAARICLQAMQLATVQDG